MLNTKNWFYVTFEYNNNAIALIFDRHPSYLLIYSKRSEFY
jgi:hypothetical protein